MATDNKHVTWIDCLKGIGILSVVFAHVTDIKSVFVFSIPLFYWSVSYRFAEGAHYLLCSSTSLFTSASLAIAMCGWALWAQ